ncbi:anamorsin homolog isoform X1 [Juglans microcarpa x Juglans regia]|uniref:anamorsin homolog isoform X1 n=1 Tax=Juglans microcarpa x Juglans regia TaxID=2249226 RepID=UPI001B7DD408|nr:anamorsin homolog isoform X1 [Juglans microcarpa x Juglans regia]
MDNTTMQGCMLAFTDDARLSITAIYTAYAELGIIGAEQGCDPQIITQASSLNQLPVETSSLDYVICICGSAEFPSDRLFEEVSRVLKPAGTILIHGTSQSVTGEIDKTTSTLQRKLLLVGFLEVEFLEEKSMVKAKKPSWKIGSSFAIKKATQSSPKVQIDDDLDLIDEDSLLSEEDLKKPQIPLVDDCEVGSTRKACKNCTCGRAEVEEKVQIQPTVEQINIPQSACGSCGLGDAFRCSTCPYKGLPPFKLGEKVSLSGNFLAADI